MLERLQIQVVWVSVSGMAQDTRGLFQRVDLDSLKFIEVGFAPVGKP